MTDDQFYELRQLILELRVEVSDLKLRLKKQDEIADHRFSLLYEWCAPLEYKNAVEQIDVVQQIEMPDDLKSFFSDDQN